MFKEIEMEGWEKQCMLGQLLWRMHKPKPAHKKALQQKYEEKYSQSPFYS